MKIAFIIVRTLMGLLFLFASTVYFLNLIPPPEMEGDLRTFNEGLAAAGYLLPLMKTIELVCAIAFLAGRFVPLAAVVLFPITVNIFCTHLFLDPAGLPVAAFVLLGNLFVAYACQKHYRGLWSAKTQLA
jgi:putative oxidoreductase